MLAVEMTCSKFDLKEPRQGNSWLHAQGTQ